MPRSSAAPSQAKNESDIQMIAKLGQDIKSAISRDFLGREAAIELALTTILADGHLLIEDVPGSGKTSLSAGLAHCLGLGFSRIQCTNDLLPADVTGLSIYDRQTGEFVLKRGPVFTQILLADELNRAPSKTQSALLQAMEERSVTLDGETLPLPRPFLVIATQNPAEQIGTFDLPESQLDRFSASMSIGRPDHDIQLEILNKQQTDAGPLPVLSDADALGAMQASVRLVSAERDILDYIIRVADAMEVEGAINLSVRYRSQLLRLSQARAGLSGRGYVTPDDVQYVFPASVRHRLGRTDMASADQLSAQTLNQVKVP